MSNKQGHVYILESENCDCIKIGGTAFPPAKRVNEINETEPYKSLGRWKIVDSLEVSDWRKVEHNLHYRFRDFRNNKIANQKELFYIHRHIAVEALNSINPEEILYKPKIDRLFQDDRFLKYISNLFLYSGLIYCIDIQGVWTLSIYTQTNQGRFFTINIGSHEVAFSTFSKNDIKQLNYIVVDKMILDSEFTEIRNWIQNHGGEIRKANYKTALNRAYYIFFRSDFDTACELFNLPGFTKLIISYWYDALISKRNDCKMSTYERYHNYNAVSKIISFIKTSKSILYDLYNLSNSLPTTFGIY